MATTKPVREITKTITPTGSNLILLDDGISMGKGTLQSAVSAVANPLIATAIDNLDLGTAAQEDIEAFATASQGSKADSAVQTVNGKTGASVTLTPGDVGAATSAQGALADSALQPGTGKAILGVPYINVKSDFGAAGDGLADDTDNIQAAINFAGTLPDGGTIFFPSGVYLTSDALSMKSKVRLLGEGRGSIIRSVALPTGGSGYGMRQVDCRGISGFSISGLNFDAEDISTFAAGFRSILCTEGANDYAIFGNYFTTPGAAVASIGCYQYRIFQNDVLCASVTGTSHHDGVIDQWGGSHDFIITENVVNGDELGHYLILVTGEDTSNQAAACYNFTISNNRVYDAQDVGIWVNGRKGVNYNFWIIDNLIIGVRDYFGIAVSDSYGCFVRGNRIINTPSNAIRLYSETSVGGTASVDRATVSGNIIKNANTGNNASRADGSAISVQNACTRCNITGNIVEGTAHTVSVHLASGGSGNFVGDTISDAGTRGTVSNESSSNRIQRERLTADRIYYVRSDGSDTANDGLANTSLRAFATIQKAVDAALSIDAAGFNVTISVGAGTRTVGAVITAPLMGGGSLVIQGDPANPSNCTINATSDAFYARYNARVTVRGFKITTSAGSAFNVDNGAILTLGNIEFGTCAYMHINAGSESVVFVAFSYSISGGAVGHFHTGAPATLIVNTGVTITLTGTPAFSSYFSGTAGGYQALSNASFSGSATGKRFLAHKNGVIDVGTTDLTFLPGSTAGTTESGGKYCGDVTSPDLIGKVDVYTPALTGVTNVDSVTAIQSNYAVMGSDAGRWVEVWGALQVDPTATATPTEVGISLPIASTLTSSSLFGQAVSSSGGTSGAIAPDTVNSRAKLNFNAPAASLFSFYFNFRYKVA